MRHPAMATEKVTAMLLQNFDGSQKIWPIRLKDQPVFAVREIVHREVFYENPRENIFDEIFLNKIAGQS